MQVDVGEGTVEGGVITFTATGSARQVRPVDAAALKRQVLGLSEADARKALEPFGDVELVLWPGFVTSVPTLEQRVTAGGPRPGRRDPGGLALAAAQRRAHGRAGAREPRRRPSGPSRYHRADAEHQHGRSPARRRGSRAAGPTHARSRIHAGPIRW